MPHPHYVIIGNGPAGVTAAETLRGVSPRARIVLVGDEPGPPYARMAIPYLLEGRIAEAGTHLRKDAEHWTRLGIELFQDRAEAVDPEQNRVILQHHGALHYDGLLIASGSRPVVPDIPGVRLPGVHTCWTLADARGIIQRATSGSRVVLMGAGFIGSIILESLVRRGIKLTVVEAEGRMVPRMLDPQAGAMLRDWCEERGVRIRLGTRVREILPGQGDVSLSIRLDDDTPLDADLVITAVGVRPNTGFLQGSGISLGKSGMQVDRHLRTGVPNIFAAGDVAEGPDIGGGYSVHAIQPTAAEHGRIAALNMAGLETPYRGSLNMNVLDTLGLISASFGRWDGDADGESVENLDRRAFRYLRLRFNGECLVGAVSVGHTEHLGVLRGLIHGRVPLGHWKPRLLENPARLMEAYLQSARII